MAGKKDKREVEKYIKLIERFSNAQPTSDVTFLTRRSHDYDGYPLEDFLTLICYEGSGHYFELKVKWEIRLAYASVIDVRKPYDYTTLAARSNTTAYTSRPDGPKQETRFVLKSYYFMDSYNNELLEENGIKELFKYGPMYEKLAVHLETLESWVASGMSMRITCGTLGCGQITEFSNDNLLNFFIKGYTLNNLKEKCVCKKCGSRYPFLKPPKDAFSYPIMKQDQVSR
jgi:hypothetical protein